MNPVPVGSDMTLTVHTMTITPLGTKPLNVLGFANSITHYAPFNLTVVASASTSYEAEAPGNTLSGGAKRRACAFCSGAGEVGGILGHGKPDALQFNNVVVAVAGTYDIVWSYVAGDPNGDTKCGGEPNPPPQGCRPGNLVVNGTSQGIFQFPDTPDWHTLGTFTTRLALAAGANTIKISSATADVADIDRIVVES
jgi:alpha-glucosidase